MDKDNALKMAHKTFMQLNERSPRKEDGSGYFDKEINACKEALEQPAQEPVAWMSENAMNVTKWKDIAQGWVQHGGKAIPLYTHPHQWQGLTEDEIKILLASVGWIFPDSIKTTDSDYSLKAVLEAYKKIVSAIRAIEQALKEKNT